MTGEGARIIRETLGKLENDEYVEKGEQGCALR